jgi:beta-phosphoglucomutase
MKSIKAIIFDCDGTLVDSENAHYLSWCYALQQHGQDMREEDYPLYVGRSSSLIAQQLSEEIPASSAAQIQKNKRFYYHELAHKGLPPIEPTVEFLRQLLSEKEGLGIKVGVCSAAKKSEILLHLEHLGVADQMDVVLSGSDDLGEFVDPEGVNKPKPYIYLLAMKKLHVSPAECVVIEDSAAGVRAAVDAGCYAIAVPNAYTRTHDLSHANLRLNSFAGLSVNKFLELLQ